MLFKNVSNINKLMVLGSSVCNLNCSYCYLHDQHKSNAYVLLNKEVQKAWRDGTYVENIKKVFDAIECSPATVTSLEFWGGEPIIVANNLKKPIRDLIDYLPNVKEINIPTNFTRINGVVDLLETVDEALIEKEWDKNEDELFYFHLQLSIDAPPGPMQDSGHSFDWNIYRENIDNLFKELKSRPVLKNTQLCIEIHATLPKESMLKYLPNIQTTSDYLMYFNDFHKYINNKINEYDLGFTVTQGQVTVYPHIAQPYSMSMDEAFEFTKDMALLEYTQYCDELGHKDGMHLLAEAGLNSTATSMIIPNPVCLESGLMGLTIMHDGTICECPCDYILSFEPYWDWIKSNPLKQKEYREALLKQKFYINPLTATQEEKDEYDWYIYNAVRLNNSTMIHLMMNFCMEMALSKQIDYTMFNNPEKLLQHLYIFNNDYSCPREQLPATNNVYLTSADCCRRLLNGVSRIGYDDLKEETMLEIKGVTQWKIKPLT